MIIVLKPNSTEEIAKDILRRIEEKGLRPLFMPGKERIVRGALGDDRVLGALRLQHAPASVVLVARTADRDDITAEDLDRLRLLIGRTVRRQSPDNPLKIVQLEISLTPNQSLRLRPGMRFRGRVETDRIEDALLAPLDALVSTPEGPVALRRDGGNVERVPLTLGRRNAELVEVLEGLAEGDEIVRPSAIAGPETDAEDTE